MLQSSGLIKFSDIRTELGLTAQTPFKISYAELGGYEALNACSTYKPSETVSSTLGEWYRYNHTQPCISVACGGLYSGSYAPLTFVTQYLGLDLSTASTGDAISIICDPIGRPNRFAVYDDLLSQITTTAWLGTAAYSGPWGPSLSTSGTVTLTFTYDSSRYYTLHVDVGPAAPVSGVSDSWTADMSCAAPGAPGYFKKFGGITYYELEISASSYGSCNLAANGGVTTPNTVYSDSEFVLGSSALVTSSGSPFTAGSGFYKMKDIGGSIEYSVQIDGSGSVLCIKLVSGGVCTGSCL